MAEEATLIKLCRADEVPVGEARRFVVNDVPVALFHLPGGFYAIADTCSHEEASLSEGFIEDEIVECPRHGAQFDIETGQNRSLPATRPVAAYRVAVEGDDIYVEAPNG